MAAGSSTDSYQAPLRPLIAWFRSQQRANLLCSPYRLRAGARYHYRTYASLSIRVSCSCVRLSPY